MKMISDARCFKTFSQCGSDSWMSSSRTPPRPFKSCCLSNRKRLLPSLILYIGLNWKRPSMCSSFGLFGKASVKSHWNGKFRNIVKSALHYLIELQFLLTIQYPIDLFRLRSLQCWVDVQRLANVVPSYSLRFWWGLRISFESFQSLSCSWLYLLGLASLIPMALKASCSLMLPMMKIYLNQVAISFQLWKYRNLIQNRGLLHALLT